MLKIFFISIFSIYLVACSNQAPVSSSWDKSFESSKEVAINKNLHELEKELGNKNTF
ncbi:hypothetical protein [Gilliamella sp. Occ3-1]|uniref:hypothetical protein n=1 Tax=unclassified Gilliamella TaxID=2685620 RepID=UPI00159ED5A6|nr:hypothetical protein [Gilliamella apicola]